MGDANQMIAIQVMFVPGDELTTVGHFGRCFGRTWNQLKAGSADWVIGGIKGSFQGDLT